MKTSLSLLLLLAAVLVISHSKVVVAKNTAATPEKEAIVIPTTSKTPDTPPTTSTTTTSTTTTSTTSTTPKTTTTSTPATTTTAKTTTTTSTTTTTTTTTAAPKTTTPVPKTTTPAPHPTPAPEPVSKKWFVNGTGGSLIVEMAVQLSIGYNGTDNQTYTLNIPVPTTNETKAVGTFAPDSESLKLSWKNDSLTINFKMDNATKTYVLSGLEVMLAPEDLPHSGLVSPLMLVNNYNFYNTSLDNSYRCVRLQTFNLTTKPDNKLMGYVKMTNLQFQPFKRDQKTSFDLASDCAFETPDAVPIAVGCVLAGLVVIILAGYLISRKRNQARGYHSM